MNRGQHPLFRRLGCRQYFGGGLTLRRPKHNVRKSTTDVYGQAAGPLTHHPISCPLSFGENNLQYCRLYCIIARIGGKTNRNWTTRPWPLTAPTASNWTHKIRSQGLKQDFSHRKNTQFFWMRIRWAPCRQRCRIGWLPSVPTNGWNYVARGGTTPSGWTDRAKSVMPLPT